MNSDRDDSIKEVFWPSNGYLFNELTLTPVFCKPKLIPLKSVTLEKLERMQQDALEKLKQMEEEQKQTDEAQVEVKLNRFSKSVFSNPQYQIETMSKQTFGAPMILLHVNHVY
jgi:BBSome-interacting protein 1